MLKKSRRQRLSRIVRLALIAMTTAAAIGACSTTTHGAGPTATTVGKPSPSTSAGGQGSNCKANPKTAAMPRVKPYEPVPPVGRISVTLSGIASGTVKPGAEPTEVEVTLCNDSAVAYPKIGVVLVLKRCSCANDPFEIARGTVESFDAVSKQWIKLPHPAMGTGMDYIGTYTNTQQLPKGKAVTLRYRIALDASMVDGTGGVQAVVVVPKALVQIGKADLPFTVSQEPNAPQPASRQTVLPFSGLTYPTSVTADPAGNVYVVDRPNNRVLRLAAGSDSQTVLPFTGVQNPGGVAADAAGNVYVTDSRNSRVLELPAGSNSQTVLPFTGLDHPRLVAVDGGGNVYVTDRQQRVLRLAAGSRDQTVLPLDGVESAGGLAVDSTGNVYVNDDADCRVVKLAAGSGAQTAVPLTGLHTLGMAVDLAGNLYVVDVDTKRLLEVPAGTSSPIVLPFKVLNGPQDVAVDGAGNLYVLDSGSFGQVVKLTAG